MQTLAHIDVHKNTVHACVTRLLHSHNPELLGPLWCCWGFTSLFVSSWLLWSPIRTPSPLIGLPDVRRRFTLVMYWSGPEGCTCVWECVCVYRCVCLCLYELVFFFVLCTCAICLCLRVPECVCVCVYISLLCASKPFWPLCTPQAVSTALELVNSGPACSDCSTIHKHRGVFSLAEYKKYNFWPVIPTSPIFFFI